VLTPRIEAHPLTKAAPAASSNRLRMRHKSKEMASRRTAQRGIAVRASLHGRSRHVGQHELWGRQTFAPQR
jgi:hypothetical protein